MTDTTLNRRPKPFSAVLAAVIVGVVGFAAAASQGVRTAGLTLVALFGTAVFVRGVTLATADPDETTNGGWAIASLAMAIGTLLALLPLFRFSPGRAALVYPFVTAVALAGIGSTSAVAVDRSAHVSRLCWRNRDALAGAALLSVLLHTGALTGLVAVFGVLGVAAVAHNSTVSLYALEGLAIALVVVLPYAQQILDEEVATPEARRIASITVDGRRLDEVLPAIRGRLPEYWWLFAGQLLLLVMAPGLLDAVLTSLPVFGPIVHGLLTSGLLHVALGGVVALAVVVVVANAVRSVVVSWADVDPPRMLASATGGVVLSLLVLVPGHLLADTAAGLLFDGTSLARTAGAYGPAALVLVALTLVMFVLPIVLIGTDMLASGLRLTTDRSGSFVVAATLGLVGTVAAAVQGVPALIVFAGVAASLLTWELGHQASYLGIQLGDAVQTRETEVVHAVGALAVGVVGIALAALAGYVIGPLSLPTGSDQAYLALVLALASALSFVLALEA